MRSIIAGSLALLLWTTATASAEELNVLWQDVTHNLHARDVSAIAVDPTQPATIFVGGQGIVARTTSGGRTWEQTLTLRPMSRVYAITVHGQPSAVVLAATDDGLWLSRNRGTSWHRAPLPRVPCFAVLADAESASRLWAGTAQGLYRSDDMGNHWMVQRGTVGWQPVYALAMQPASPHRLLVATNRGLFETADGGAAWQHRLLAQTTGEIDASSEIAQEQAAEQTPPITAMTWRPERAQELVIIADGHLLVSHDAGRSWQTLPGPSSAVHRVHHVLATHASAPRLYVASDHGVWTLDDTNAQWQELHRGMTATSVRQLAMQPLDGSLWSATDAGVFHGVVAPSGADAARSSLTVWTLFQHEPTIVEVQAWAIRASETDPKKIARFRRAAATKALLPTVSLSLDRKKNISDHYDEGTFPKFQLIPTRDRNRNWGVGVSWDLGKLIWNDDQTAIDARSKLTVELREAILTEATRLYFERRRLQTEAVLKPLDDPQALLERELRVQELTAQLDALTDGEFSRALEGH